jgi:hypothetical protein
MGVDVEPALEADYGDGVNDFGANFHGGSCAVG